jgi:hypothetical protein
MKAFCLKHKRVIWIACAVLFVVVLFFIKNKNLFESTEKYFGTNQQVGLTYGPDTTVADLVNKSSTGDGIPDWEKVLLGLDPTKTENIPGVPDSVTIAKLQAQQKADGSGQVVASTDNSNLNQTDTFSKELFATVATLDASGAVDANGNMDQTTVDKLSSSLENSIQNSPQRKIYTLSDLNITNDSSEKALKKYVDTLNILTSKKPLKYTALDVLNKFSPDNTGVNTDPTVLPELDPIISKNTALINGMLKMEVPQPLSTMHLNYINALEGLVENISDVKLYNTDPIISFSGMSKYETNITALESASQGILQEITLLSQSSE